MQCPACGHESTDGAMQCASCKHPFGSVTESPKVEVRVSRLAIASVVCACIAWLGFVPQIIATWDQYVLSPESLFVVLTGMVALVSMGLSFWLGIAGLTRLWSSGGRRTGYGFAVIGIVTPVVLVALSAYVHVAAWGPSLGSRMTCGTHLCGIGKAMLIYANDYGDRLPAAGGQGTVWGPGLDNWRAASREEAFGLDPNATGGKATVSSSLYLLIRHMEVPPKSFICGGDRRPRVFKPQKYGLRADRLTEVWDFGQNPTRHCSYAYHIPYGRYALTTFRDPRVAVAADRNPWMDSRLREAGDFSRFQPDVTPFTGTVEQAQQGNTWVHKRDGQNVLFLDSHVAFAKRPFVGLDDDNIYTSWDGQDAIRGVPPQPYDSRPANEFDSLLVNDPPVDR